MKRILCFFLAVSVLLTGCGFFGQRIKDPVTFYYLCSKYPEELCCVIVSEEREASGHVGNLPYLLALYLMGPSNDELVSPLRPGVQITSKQDGTHIYLELSNLPSTLSDIDFSLTCACLTLTCLDITGAEDVTISSGDRVKTMNRQSLTLYDTADETISTEETE